MGRCMGDGRVLIPGPFCRSVLDLEISLFRVWAYPLEGAGICFWDQSNNGSYGAVVICCGSKPMRANKNGVVGVVVVGIPESFANGT